MNIVLSTDLGRFFEFLGILNKDKTCNDLYVYTIEKFYVIEFFPTLVETTKLIKTNIIYISCNLFYYASLYQKITHSHFLDRGFAEIKTEKN